MIKRGKILEAVSIFKSPKSEIFHLIQDDTVIKKGHYIEMFAFVHMGKELEIYVESSFEPDWHVGCNEKITCFIIGDGEDWDSIEVPTEYVSTFLALLKAVNRHYGYDAEVCGI